MFSNIKAKACIVALLGSAILAFALYNVHSLSGVTEGGGLGLILLFQHWFGISPAISSLIFNVICYAIGWKVMGKDFIVYSILSCIGFSCFYALFEGLGPFWPQLADMPLVASIVGAVFVGVGAGLCVRIGGAPGADDALAMSLSKMTKFKIQWIYLISDLVVLLLSATYIPWSRLSYSLLTVILSGQLIGLIQNMQFGPRKKVCTTKLEQGD